MEKYLFEMPERSAALCLADNVSLAQVSEIAAHYAKRGENASNGSCPFYWTTCTNPHNLCPSFIFLLLMPHVMWGDAPNEQASSWRAWILNRLLKKNTYIQGV